VVADVDETQASRSAVCTVNDFLPSVVITHRAVDLITEKSTVCSFNNNNNDNNYYNNNNNSNNK